MLQRGRADRESAYEQLREGAACSGWRCARRLAVAAVLLATWLAASVANAAVVTTEPAPDDPVAGYPTVAHAVFAARRYVAASVVADREFVGAVLRDTQGRHFLTMGVAPPDTDSVSFAIRYGGGRRVVALWHTHGASGPARELFSPRDSELARSVGLPFYLLTPSGEVRVLRPDHPAEPRLWVRFGNELLRAPEGASRGEPVLLPSSEVLLAQADDRAGD